MDVKYFMAKHSWLSIKKGYIRKKERKKYGEKCCSAKSCEVVKEEEMGIE